MGLELHHPIMSKLWGLGDQTYRQRVTVIGTSILTVWRVVLMCKREESCRMVILE